MQVKTQPEEQRNSTRFNVGENVYALLKQPQYHELGKIIDISETGISFLCLNEGDWADEPFSIDIISSEERQESGNMMTIRGLPLRPISYCRDEDQDKAAVDLCHALKRCGVAFDQLNNQQKSLLDTFIARHAINLA